ncbi:MAG: cell division protein ZapA [Brevundimonas sp.]|uniref:cell division protein ZapA n=1 Tax=Brevundimonas sp. TaxID=1871086 RepID=UPI0025BE948F|nr:cell division protein ZapA [Brevundimonas sp.]MBX3477645.1 cell division protein ZapA [Brevundimonas sp.]
MATVTVDINGRPYAVGCADGQEERVRVLARQFDAHVRQVGRDVGHVGDIRLFLMAALVLADELQEARLAQANGGTVAPPTGEAEAGVAEALNAVAARIEKIAQSL